jgi:transcriptional regulator with XRE-family HTH domain
MATKAQHGRAYRRLPPFLRALREDAGLTQRQLGERLGKPQSWIYNCETANRRVDVTEFIAWAKACGVEPADAFKRFLALR